MLSTIRSLGAVVALALGLAAISDYAAAQDAHEAQFYGPSVPAFCGAKPQRTQKYQQGLSRGTQRADELFASAEIGKNPQKLQRKIDRVLERLFDNVRDAWRAEARDNKRCRVQGVADGFVSRIVELIGQCILDGAQWGQFAANTYCALSLELGGLGDTGVFVRAPVGLCGSLFQANCDGVYAFVATEGRTDLPSAVAKFCSDRDLDIQPYAGCHTYTTGSFTTVFNNSRGSDCAY